MKTKLIKMSLACAMALIALTGCSKFGSNPPQALDSSKIPATVSKAFAKSPEETRQAAASYVSAFEGQDVPAAFLQLRKVSAQNDLTPEQRTVVARAMQTTFKQLQTAAQKGNAAAQSVMHQYVSSR